MHSRVCPVRKRLLKELLSAMREQSDAVGEIRSLTGQAELASPKERVIEASKTTQEAWTAYQAHVDEHKCL
jgi:hypothetical protein